MDIEKMEPWIRVSMLLLVAAGYFVFLAVLFQRTMQTDEYVRDSLDHLVRGVRIPDSPADLPSDDRPPREA